jgi:tetratricopeptide (TPR) repeat protein
MRSRFNLVLFVSILSAAYAQTSDFPSELLGTWEYVHTGSSISPRGSGSSYDKVILRLDREGTAVKGSVLIHITDKLQSGEVTGNTRWKVQFEVVPLSGHSGDFMAKLIGGTMESLNGSALVAPCDTCTSWEGPVGTNPIVGNLRQTPDNRLRAQFFFSSSPPMGAIIQGGSPAAFNRPTSQTAFDDFLASDFGPIPTTATKSGAASNSKSGVSKQDGKHMRELLANASHAMASGDCKKAIPLYQSYLEYVQAGKIGKGAFPLARTAIADCYERMGRNNDAVEESKQIIALETYSYTLGIAYGRIGDTTTALAKLRDAIDGNPIGASEGSGSDSAALVIDPFSRSAVILEKAGRTDEAALMRKESAIHAEARKAANPYVKRSDYGGADRARIKVYMKYDRPLYAQAARKDLQDLQAAGGDTGPVPSVAATVLGVATQGAADLAQTRAEGQATVAAAKEQAAARQAEQQAAQQAAAQQAAAQAAAQQAATRTSTRGNSQQPQYSTTCLRFQMIDKDVYTTENACAQPVDAKWCWLRTNGTWDCYMSLGKQPGVPEKLFRGDWTTSVKQWTRTPGLDAPWPEP